MYLWALIAQATCSLVPSSWVGACIEKCFNYPHVNVPASEFLKLAKKLLLPAIPPMLQFHQDTTGQLEVR